MGAAENYQPWQDSRPHDDGGHVGVLEVETAADGANGASTGTEGVNHDGDYHGYGIIGGIMLLDLVRIREQYPGAGAWLRHAASSVEEFRRNR